MPRIHVRPNTKRPVVTLAGSLNMALFGVQGVAVDALRRVQSVPSVTPSRFGAAARRQQRDGAWPVLRYTACEVPPCARGGADALPFCILTLTDPYRPSCIFHGNIV